MKMNQKNNINATKLRELIKRKEKIKSKKIMTSEIKWIQTIKKKKKN